MAHIREIVLNILIEYDRDGVRKPSLLKDSLDKYDYLESRDKAFIKRVVDGCIERQIQLDYIIDSFAKTKVKDMQPFIRSLMRMSTYQIMFMDQVPDSAACNEAVKLAQKHKFAGLKGFVNGVLRNISRNKEKIAYPDKSLNGGVDYLHACYSMPKWICEMWVAEYGLDKTEEFLKFFLIPRPTTVRVAADIEVDELAKDLTDAGCIVNKSDILPYALNLEKTDNIRFLPGFEEGSFFAQDVSSMLVTQLADPKPGQVVIDVCAAPGGKSLHAAERVLLKDNANEQEDADSVNTDSMKGMVFSRDVSERKCDLIRENAERMKLTNVKVEMQDARVHDRNLESKADVLYLDLPCSGLGIIGRKVDIKYNVTRQSAAEVAKLQWEIIKTAWDYVQPGGTLMYSTCTVNKAENEDMVSKICQELPFEPVDFSALLPDALKNNDGVDTLIKTAKTGYIQLLPGEHGTDGFFIAKLRRKT
jgi:16S rRNA (cytosine967-C5)-methyltransferase